MAMASISMSSDSWLALLLASAQILDDELAGGDADEFFELADSEFVQADLADEIPDMPENLPEWVAAL